MINTLSTTNQTIKLQRFPPRANDLLQAWDAADQYLLEWWHQAGSFSGGLLLLNDAFGALTCALHRYQPTVSTDSFISHQSIQHNLALNHLEPQDVTLLNSLQPWPDTIDRVIIKLPKSLAMLEAQLAMLSQSLPAGVQIIGAARVKDMPMAAIKLFERFGPTVTSKAWKKARLIFSQSSGAVLPTPPAPCWRVPGIDIELSHHANVYGRQKLDQGASAFLPHLPLAKPGQQVIDLGCGNGILAIAMARQSPEAGYLLIDESHMAIASAQANFNRNLGASATQARFMVNDCLTDIPSGSADIIVCNPPFHQQQAVTDHIARQMFHDAKRVLKRGGELRVVGNRHLGYHLKLKKLFGRTEVVAATPKFVILSSHKR